MASLTTSPVGPETDAVTDQAVGKTSGEPREIGEAASEAYVVSEKTEKASGKAFTTPGKIDEVSCKRCKASSEKA